MDWRRHKSCWRKNLSMTVVNFVDARSFQEQRKLSMYMESETRSWSMCMEIETWRWEGRGGKGSWGEGKWGEWEEKGEEVDILCPMLLRCTSGIIMRRASRVFAGRCRSSAMLTQSNGVLCNYVRDALPWSLRPLPVDKEVSCGELYYF